MDHVKLFKMSTQTRKSLGAPCHITSAAAASIASKELRAKRTRKAKWRRQCRAAERYQKEEAPSKNKMEDFRTYVVNGEEYENRSKN